jgi:vacuolar protein sorting-associated protein 18
MYLHYATVIGDYARVIEHWVMEEEWLKAIDVLNRQVGNHGPYLWLGLTVLQSDLELYYRFAPALMRQAPKETVDSWLRRRDLDPLRLVPALLRLQHMPRDPLSPNQAVRYLNYIIFEQGNTSPVIHNLMITFYAANSALSLGNSRSPTVTIAPEDDGPLLRFLTSAPSDPLTGRPYYDLDYALRLCKQTGRTQPCVHIYAQMGLWESSVDLALEKGDLELARTNADMPPEEDRQLRKRLWLKIAKYVVQQKQDIKMYVSSFSSYGNFFY